MKMKKMIFVIMVAILAMGLYADATISVDVKVDCPYNNASGMVQVCFGSVTKTATYTGSGIYHFDDVWTYSISDISVWVHDYTNNKDLHGWAYWPGDGGTAYVYIDYDPNNDTAPINPPAGS